MSALQAPFPYFGGKSKVDPERGGKRPHLGNSGQGVHRQLGNNGHGVHPCSAWFTALSAQLRRVRVCCGDWKRVTGPTATFVHGVTGVFLDPPYADTAGRATDIYKEEDLSVAHDVREWAIEAGKNPLLRICLCGYEGEHQMPADWECVAWKTSGGYGMQGNSDYQNKHRERLWFSPACVKPSRQRTLLAIGD